MAVILILVAINIVLVVLLTKKGTSDWQIFAYCIEQFSQLCFLPLMSRAQNILYVSHISNITIRGMGDFSGFFSC